MSKINIELLRNVRDCLTKSKWFMCQIFFPTCYYDTESNSWQVYPICQESCSSYVNIESCKNFIKFLLQFNDAAEKCRAHVKNLDRVNCSLYPTKPTSQKCYSKFYGKQNCELSLTGVLANKSVINNFLHSTRNNAFFSEFFYYTRNA